MSNAVALADAAAVSDIRCNGIPQLIDDQTWYDTRAMLDEREVSPHGRDLAAVAIEHALDRRLAERHLHYPHLLRIVRR